MNKDSTSIIGDFMTGGGEMGELIRSIEWSRTPVGPVDSWPQSLRTAISIMLNTHFPMYIAWGDGFTQFYNDGYRPILGSTKHPAAMGLSTKVTFAEIWNIIGPMFEGVMQGNAVGFTDFMLPLDRHGFTEECYFIFSYSPIKQENGLTGGVLVTVTETTDRVLSERRLKTLHDLGDRSADSKTLKDAAENILEVLRFNKYDIPFSILYLYNAETRSFESAGVSGLVPEETVNPDPARMLQYLSEAQIAKAGVLDVFDAISFEKDIPWPDQVQNCCVSLLSRPDQKNAFGFLICGLSPRLQYNEHYHNFIKILTDQCITVLSNANAFEEERKRVEALAEIDKAKTAFFSNISHEFRTPLTLMLGPIEDIINDQLNKYPPESKELFSLVHRNGLRLQKLVNNLLDFSRIEAGRIHASYQCVDLPRLTAELASNFRSAIEKAGLTLTVACPPLPEKLFVDVDMWEKIVLNLLSNAFKHTFEGNITVATKWSGNKAQVIVKDSGIGIPLEQLPHLFERFHRVPNVRSRTYEGSGIGLALVNELVKLHGGSIEAESEVDKGTTFTVTIPAGKDHLPQEHILDSKETSHSGVDRRSFVEEALRWLPMEGLGTLHNPFGDADAAANKEVWSANEIRNGLKPVIVLADDNADMRDYVKNILSPFCDVIAVGNGKAALEISGTIKPDLILCDVMMPELDGFEVVKTLRNDPSLSSMPVILLSARAGEGSKVEGLTAGADDYLTKPFTSRELIARVRANLQLYETRKIAQQAIKKSEARLRAFVTATSDVIYRMSPDWQEMWRLEGRSFLEDTGEPISNWQEKYIHPKDRQRVWQAIDLAIRTKSVFQLEHEVIRADGTLGWTFSRAVPILETNGDIIEWYGVASDVTERKRYEVALVESEAKFRRFYESSMLPVAFWNVNGKVYECNDAFAALVGYDRSEILSGNYNWIEATSPEYRQLHDKFVHIAVEGKVFVDPYEVKLIRPNGSHVTVVVGYTMLESSKEKGVAFFMDITVQKSLMTELEVRVAERTRELNNVNQALQQSNVDLMQFAHVASHDLKEPVRKIKTFANQLKDEAMDTLNEKAKTFLNKILSSADRMSNMIEGVLSYSTINAFENIIELVDLNTVLTDIKSDLEVLINQKHAAISHDSLPAIEGNRFLLYQLFYNLLNNALKFTKTEVSPCISITSSLLLRNKQRYVEIVMTDNGIGFDPVHSEHIFDTFARLHPKDRYEGTGLGLALCKKIVQRHSGTIEAKGKKGDGASFIICLPVIQNTEGPNEVSAGR